MPEKKPEITLEEIVAIRESLGLTQAQAGKLLGGGPSAYAKYEAGTVRPAAAAANLLRLLKAHPEMLAALRGAEPLAISAGASARSPFEVSGADIESLPREDLPELLRRLLTAEAEVHGLPADGIHVADNADAPDGGEDGRITWENGPERTRFLPSRHCQFQLKSGPVQPAQAGREILDRNGAVKDMVRKFLEDGGHYLMLCAKEYTRKAIEKREKRIRDALREAGLSKACDRIQFRDAGQISNWVNHHPAVAAWVKEKIGSGVPGPFRSWSHWDGRAEHAAPWIEDERLLEFRARLLERARQPRGIARVVGPYGVGKSRLALQALGPAGADRSISDLVLYADEAEAGPHAVGKVIQRLADAGARAIAVVNRCSPERRRILENMALREGSRLSLVTIDDDEAGTSSGEEGLIKVREPATAVIEAIIDHRSQDLPREDRERLVRFSAGVPKIAVLVARAWRGSGSLAQAADDGLVDAVMGRHSRERDLLRKAAKLLAVFGLIDPRPESGDELDRIAAFGNLESDDLYAALTDLAGRGVVRRRGGLMLFPPSPIAMNLAVRQWREWRTSKWGEVLGGGIGSDLGFRAAKRLALLNDTDTAKKVVDRVCRVDGPLDKILTSSASARTDMLVPLAEIDASIVVKLLDRSLDQIGDGPAIRGSSDITRALSRIAFRADAFGDGARLLLRLASKSRQRTNGAARQFISLFPVCLGNTAAGGEDRLRFLDEAIDNNRPDERPIVVEALLKGLQTHRFRRYVGTEIHGARPALEPWLPGTHQEAREYISGCMTRLVPFAKQDDEAGRAIRAKFGWRLRGLLNYGLIDAVEKATAGIRKTAGCWPEAINGLGQFLKYDAAKRDRALAGRVRMLIEKLQPQELEDRGRFLVTSMPSDYPADQELTHEERHRLQVREVEELAAEFIKHPKRLQRFLPEISSGQQRMAFAFGRALADASDSPPDRLEPIAEAVAGAPEKERNFDLLCGYLAGIRERHPGAVDDFKRRAARSPELAPALPAICRNCGIKPTDVGLAIAALEAKRLRPDQLLQWDYCREFAEVPAAAAIPLFDWLLGHGEKAFRVGICLLGPYACEEPGNFDDLRPQIRRVAENAARHEPETDGGALGYHFEQIMRKALEKGWQDAGARAVALTLAKALAGIDEWGDGGLIRPVLPLLLSKFTEIVWPVLGQAIVSAPNWGDRFRQVLEGRAAEAESPLILNLPEATLFEWCREHPERAPAFAANVLPVLDAGRSDDSGPTLHPVLSRLLDEFGEREDVQSEIASNIRECIWSGPQTDYYSLFQELLEPLRRAHPKKPVRRWAREMLRFLREQAEAARRKDEEREARREV